jgi:hypothetical protein
MAGGRGRLAHARAPPGTTVPVHGASDRQSTEPSRALHCPARRHRHASAVRGSDRIVVCGESVELELEESRMVMGHMDMHTHWRLRYGMGKLLILEQVWGQHERRNVLQVVKTHSDIDGHTYNLSGTCRLLVHVCRQSFARLCGCARSRSQRPMSPRRDTCGVSSEETTLRARKVHAPRKQHTDTHRLHTYTHTHARTYHARSHAHRLAHAHARVPACCPRRRAHYTFPLMLHRPAPSRWRPPPLLLKHWRQRRRRLCVCWYCS